jgi:predicted metalloprotease with PDZ domain
MVHSFGGLTTMAGLLERMGRLTEAEQYFQNAYERYDGGISPLVEFLVRHRKEARLAGSLEGIVAAVFPQGLQPVRKEDVGVPRPAGVLLMGMPDASEAKAGPSAGLFVGDVVVGLDSIRVGTLQQLRVQSRLSTEAEISIIYWRRGATLEARVPRLALREYGFETDPPR